MNDQELISHIEELGLSNKEARIYVACLKTGPSAVQRIADQADIKRVTTYVVLESLVGLGLVSQSVKGKKTYFIAEEPSNLSRLLEKRENDLKVQRLNFSKVLPELLGLKVTPKESPDVKFYDSADGIRTLFSTFMALHANPGDVIYGISNLDQLQVFFPERGKTEANPERLKNLLYSKFIYTTNRGKIYSSQDDTRDNRESRFIPIEKYPLNGDISIVGDYIIMISLTGTNPIGITIRSRELAAGMLAIFQLIWDSSEQFN